MANKNKELEMNVAIVGLGLMGGSLAISLKKLDFIDSIVGSDHNKIHQQEAMELGLVDNDVQVKVKNILHSLLE